MRNTLELYHYVYFYSGERCEEQKGVLFACKWPQRPSRDGARSREAPQQEERCPVTQGACTVCQTNANWIARSENKAKRGVRSDYEWPQSSPCACVMAFSGTRLIESHTGHRHFQRWVCLGANYCLANMRAVANFTQSCTATTQGSVFTAHSKTGRYYP